MNLLGIDPGTHKTGVCLIKDGRFFNAQTLKAPRRLSPDQRMIRIVSLLANYVDAWAPEGQVHVAVEKPVYMEHTATSGDFPYRRGTPIPQLYLFMGGLRVYIEFVCGYPYHVYEVPDIKNGVFGQRNATKEDVQDALRMEYGLDGRENGFGQPLDPEQWDALAVATHHLRQERLAQAVISGDPYR